MRALLMASVVILGWAGSADAATIVQSLDFAPMSAYGSENGSPVNQFDPSLGTLTAITFSAADTVQFSGGSSTSINNAYMIIRIPFLEFGHGAGLIGNGSVTSSVTNANAISPAGPASGSTNPTLLGTGTFIPTILFENYNELSASASVLLSETLNYTYTPAVVPEPVSVALFVAGVLGMLVVARRQRGTYLS